MTNRSIRNIRIAAAICYTLSFVFFVIAAVSENQSSENNASDNFSE